MPWYLLGVFSNRLWFFIDLPCYRNISDVLGFSWETLIAVTTNIEDREHLRRQRINSSCQLEHPRASSTDDVECLFSMMRDTIGQNFTTNEVKFGMRKIISQFSKRIDPNLPFYYYTSAHSRCYEGSNPDFNRPPVKQLNEKGNNLQLLHPGMQPCPLEKHFL